MAILMNQSPRRKSWAVGVAVVLVIVALLWIFDGRNIYKFFAVN